MNFLEEAEKNQAIQKGLQPVELPVGRAVSFRFPIIMTCHTCWVDFTDASVLIVCIPIKVTSIKLIGLASWTLVVLVL